MAVNFKSCDRSTPYLFPPTVQDYLPEDHLACFIVEIVEQLDLTPFIQAYSGKGKPPYHPSMLISLLFYGYATGTFSSRKLEKASHDSIAVRFICANTHPDHDTIAHFRKRFLSELSQLFLEVLLIANTMGLLKLGTVSLDGTKVKANASKHKALSWAHANKIELQLKEEVAELMRKAEAADNSTLPEDMDIPDELARRNQRLKVIAEAKKEIQARAAERYKREKSEYDEKVMKRTAYEESTGKKSRGRKPVKPLPEPLAKDQVNLTDEESRIMPSKNGFEQAYNSQACVDIETHMVVENHVTQACNDKLEIAPALENLKNLPEELGEVEKILADTGYFSESNVDRCENENIEPSIAEKRQSHNLPLDARFGEDPKAPENPTPVEAMKHRLQTKAGREIYGKRKSTVETVFGIIKEVMGFRQFSLRGLKSVQGEWSLVCLAWNLKRMHVLQAA